MGVVLDTVLAIPAAGWMSLVPLLPFLAALVLFTLPSGLRNRMRALAPLAMSISFVLAFCIFIRAYMITSVGDMTTLSLVSFPLLSQDGFVVALSLMVDRTSSLLLPIIALVSLVIQVFTMTQVSSDRRIGLLLAYLSLFSAALEVMVMAAGLVTMLAAWAVMGIVSLLVTAFWWERPHLTRGVTSLATVGAIADVALLGAVGCALVGCGSVDFTTMSTATWVPGFETGVAACTVGAALARSLQLPFFTGRTDAITAPPTASALTSSFGTLAGGTLLVFRMYPVLVLVPVSLMTLLAVGCVIAPLAAASACVQYDIRRVLACSLASQVGVIMIALGIDAPLYALLHLVASIFFAPLLLLAFSVVIRVSGTRDIREMGGLWRNLPVTALLLTIGSLSLVGVIPLAGYFSRDGILTTLFSHGEWLVMAVVLLTSFLSVIYIGRVCSYAFLGDSSPQGARDPGILALVPMGVLALGSCALGLASPAITSLMGQAIGWPRVDVTLVSTLVVFAAIWMAWHTYASNMTRAVNRRTWWRRFLAGDWMGSDGLFAPAFRFIARGISSFDSSPVISATVAMVVGIAVILVVVGS
jgi:NADH-quinone oxidoreductase subunit L